MAKAKGATPRKQHNGLSLFAAMLIGGVLTLTIGFFLYLWNPFNQGKVDPVTDASSNSQNTHKADSTTSNYEFYDLLPEQKTTGLPNQAIGDRVEQIVNPNIKPDVVINVASSASLTRKSDKTATTAAHTNAKTGTGVAADNDSPSDEATNVTTVKNPLDNNKATNLQGKQGKGSISLVETNRRYILQINSFKTAEEADARRAQVLIAGVDAQIVKKGLSDGTIIYQVISRPMVSEQAVADAQTRLQDNGIDSLIVEQRIN